MKEGGLVPYKLTVQVLANAMIQNPAKVSHLLLIPKRSCQPYLKTVELLNRRIPTRPRLGSLF
jgi:hypothetical protein